MPKRDLTEAEQETFENVLMLLHGMLNDRSVPRNIKRVAQKSITTLENLAESDESPGVIASNVMYMVDDLCQDPNCPFHSRTTFYRIISLLESVKD